MIYEPMRDCKYLHQWAPTSNEHYCRNIKDYWNLPGLIANKKDFYRKSAKLKEAFHSILQNFNSKTSK